MSGMGRRAFITLLGGAAAAGPLVARAQQTDRMRRIGVLMKLAADDPEAPARVAAFAQGLQELGWTMGRNVRIDTRWPAGDADRSHIRGCPNCRNVTDQRNLIRFVAEMRTAI